MLFFVPERPGHTTASGRNVFGVVSLRDAQGQYGFFMAVDGLLVAMAMDEDPGFLLRKLSGIDVSFLKFPDEKIFYRMTMPADTSRFGSQLLGNQTRVFIAKRKNGGWLNAHQWVIQVDQGAGDTYIFGSQIPGFLQKTFR